MGELTIYIADDHAIVVDGLKEILKVKSDWRILGTANDGQSLIDLVTERRSHVVILDINMPKVNGIKCTEWIKKQYPEVRVIILTMFPEKTYVDQLILAGADGCLLKSRGGQDLIDAIERVTSGRSYFDTIKDFVKGEPDPGYHLSERELEIIRLIIHGETSQEIADRLFISEHTVKTHRKNIFRKLGLNSTSQLATFAINHNILP
jgi:DNA-binding NarL/FixJ family response regulator